MANIGVFAAVFNNQNEILCTKINYASKNWTLPGGHLEKNESPAEGAKREVLEETGYIVDIENLISVYSAPEKDELVFVFKAVIKGQIEWKPNNEIAQIGFFKQDELPLQMHPRNKVRINDAYNELKSYLTVFE